MQKDPSADNELSPQDLIGALRAYLLARNLLQDDAHTWKGVYEVPILEVFCWMMIYGVAKEFECKSQGFAKVFLRYSEYRGYATNTRIMQIEE
ncbi:hypothetical protein SO802_020807 [Lithocarpus litseifolius]|uniref:Uncharacterized protein n=1 Tax=Lithocarpus litseifolius TaxID=425828 RepID=A0AAW2CCX1_9ROSI